METKQIKIEVPQGYEIDKDKSTFENIILKPIENKLPLSVKEIKGRCWFIKDYGEIDCRLHDDDISNLSTEPRAKAFLALMQLVELRDAWNGDWRADWKDGNNKYCILNFNNSIKLDVNVSYSTILHFKKRELAEKFLAQFEDLINEAKELL